MEKVYVVYDTEAEKYIGVYTSKDILTEVLKDFIFYCHEKEWLQLSEPTMKKLKESKGEELYELCIAMAFDGGFIVDKIEINNKPNFSKAYE